MSPEPAYRQVAELLSKKIVSGEIKAGTRLPVEGELADELGVSRSTVREALRALSSQKLVNTTRGVNGGTFVSQPMSSHLSETMAVSLEWLTMAEKISLKDLLEARELLEVPAAGFAAKYRDDTDIRRLAEALPNSASDHLGAFEGSQHFHLTIVTISGNELLEMMIRPLYMISETRILKNQAPGKFWAKVEDEHQAILDAIVARDVLEAEYEMKEHLHHLRRTYEHIDRHRQRT